RATTALVLPKVVCRGCRERVGYLPFPSAIGGRSASLLTVFLPTCSPPLSRNMAKAIAIKAPRRAPSVPLRALLSFIADSDHSDLSPTAVPVAGSCARRRGKLRQPCGVSPKRLSLTSS